MTCTSWPSGLYLIAFCHTRQSNAHVLAIPISPDPVHGRKTLNSKP
jgi:hypothetical protein